MKRGEKYAFPFPPKGHQAWNLLRATKLGFSLSFFLKVQIWIIWAFFLDVTFNLNIWKFIPTTFLGRKRVISLNRWWKEGE
jgi:hypothetical protein